MSYDIIYNKQFVKLRRTGEVIPMLLAGSNNCYEIGSRGRNGRRVRSWDNIVFYNRKGKLSEKPEAILKRLEAELRKYLRTRRDKETKPADIRDHFGYYAALVVGSGRCWGTSWNQYYSVFANGIRKALTIEQLAALGVQLYFHYHDYGETDTSKYRPATVYLETEQQYFAELKKWRVWMEKYKRQPWLSFSPSDTDYVLERLRRNNRRAPKEKAPVEQDHYFTLSNQSGYLMKYTRSGFRYSFSKNGGCKKFQTEQEAEKYRQYLVDKGRYLADTWKVEKVEAKHTFMV